MNGLSETAFRIEHELSGNNNLFVFLKAFEDLKLIIVAFHAEFDFPGLKFALAERHKNDLSNAAVDDRFLGNNQAVSNNGGLEGHIRVHIRHQLIICIGEFQSEPGRAGLGRKKRINEQHVAVKNFTRNVRQFHFCRHPLSNPGELVFINIHVHPYLGKICDFILVLARFYIVTLKGILLDNHAACRRIYGECLLDVTGIFYFFNLLFAQIPVSQSGMGSFQKPLGPFPDPGVRTIF